MQPIRPNGVLVRWPRSVDAGSGAQETGVSNAAVDAREAHAPVRDARFRSAHLPRRRHRACHASGWAARTRSKGPERPARAPGPSCGPNRRGQCPRRVVAARDVGLVGSDGGAFLASWIAATRGEGLAGPPRVRERLTASAGPSWRCDVSGRRAIQSKFGPPDPRPSRSAPRAGRRGISPTHHHARRSEVPVRHRSRPL